jgi:hypothetical protein
MEIARPSLGRPARRAAMGETQRASASIAVRLGPAPGSLEPTGSSGLRLPIEIPAICWALSSPSDHPIITGVWSANRTLLPSATVRPRPDRTAAARPHAFSVDDILRTLWWSPRVAAFPCTGWQHNFALRGSITLHRVAELIAFSTKMQISGVCAENYGGDMKCQVPDIQSRLVENIHNNSQFTLVSK